MERMWKEAVVASYKDYPNIRLERLKKTTKTSIRTGVLDEIRTRDNSTRHIRIPAEKKKKEPGKTKRCTTNNLNQYSNMLC
jgi:hypothetical protein